MLQVVKASEFALRLVFDDAYLFKIPTYQRPYAWTTEEVDELLDDLTEAQKREPDSPYFLGNIILIKRNDDVPESEVVDGQQRLTTLTMMLCVLRELSTDEKHRKNIEKFIWQEGNDLDGTEDEYRLSLRDRDREFFRRHVQSTGGVAELLTAERAGLSDSRRRMVENTKHIYDALAKESEITRADFTSWILKHCFLVVVTATDRDSAYRIFSVMNNRGMNLSPTDILKAETIGEMNQSIQEHYAEIWESIEEALGREQFRDLFTHIRMIYAKDKLRQTLQRGFREHVLSAKNGSEFIDEVLVPYSEAYGMVKNASYVSTEGADEVNRYLRHLGRLDNFDWIPPAMEYFRLNGDARDKLLEFVKGLDRLAFTLFIRRADVYERIERFAEVLTDIEGDDGESQGFSSLELSSEEKAEVRERLAGDVYLVTRARLPLLLRLDGMLAGAGASYDHKIITVEHVLPQNPTADSEWTRTFPDEDVREYWTHKLANLVLLPRRKNSAAGNLDFGEKKEVYFRREGESTTFALTTRVLGEDEWTPEVLQMRQDELLAKLADEWALE